jgi:phenylalanyl-tRNA synthetase beta chain
MKIVESWLREWVNPDLDTTALGDRLTMAGHEVEGIEQDGAGLEGVVIAEVLEVEKHPDADRLSVCKVSNGSLEIVCGAPNVFKGMKTPLATPGVTLPNGLKLRKSKIRGVVSNGMLCSAVELGLGEESDGIISLAGDAPVGQAIADYLNLPSRRLLQRVGNRQRCLGTDGCEPQRRFGAAS